MNCLNDFRSSAERIDTPLDCRMLSLSFYLHRMQERQVIDLFYDLMHWTDLLGDGKFVYSAGCKGRHLRKERLAERFEETFRLEGDVSAGFDAYKISAKVYNQATLKRYRSDLSRINPVYAFGWNEDTLFGGSYDYPEYIRKVFPSGRPTNEKLIEGIHCMFQEPDRKYIGLHRNADFEMRFSVKPYQSNPAMFFGKGIISLSAFGLGDYVDLVAEKFKEYAISLAQKYLHLNIHVMLQPRQFLEIMSPYMWYFGKHVTGDGSHTRFGVSPEEWYKGYYLCGVEWVNILSPMTSQLLSPVDLSNMSGRIACAINDKVTIIAANKPITQYCVEDAFEMKQLLAPALYPGSTVHTLRAIFPHNGSFPAYNLGPRAQWEIVPISKHEITILGPEIVYGAKTGDSPC